MPIGLVLILLGESVVQPLPANPLDFGYGPTVGVSQVNLDVLWNAVVWLLTLIQAFRGAILVGAKSLIPFIG